MRLCGVGGARLARVCVCAPCDDIPWNRLDVTDVARLQSCHMVFLTANRHNPTFAGHPLTNLTALPNRLNITYTREKLEAG
jgi:hypothetical protein